MAQIEQFISVIIFSSSDSLEFSPRWEMDLTTTYSTHHGRTTRTEHQKQIWLRTHELHLLRQVHDFYRVLQFEGGSGEFGDELDMQVRYGSHGWKWALSEIEYE